MFGDVGHGSMVTAFALYLCVNETKMLALSARLRDDIITMAVRGRCTPPRPRLSAAPPLEASGRTVLARAVGTCCC